MVLKAQIAVGIDASGARAGSKEVAESLASVQHEAKRTQENIAALDRIMRDFGDRSIKPLDDKIDALGRGVTDLNGNIAAILQRMQAAEEETKRLASAQSSAATETEKHKTSLFSLDGVMQRAEQRFTGIAKAAIGFAATDIVAKVVGFGGAMDAVGKATDFAADQIQRLLGLDQFKAATSEARKLADEILRVQAGLAPKYTRNVGEVMVDLTELATSRDQQAYLDVLKQIEASNELIKTAQRTALFERSENRGGESVTLEGIRAREYQVVRDQIDAAVELSRQKERQIELERQHGEALANANSEGQKAVLLARQQLEAIERQLATRRSESYERLGLGGRGRGVQGLLGGERIEDSLLQDPRYYAEQLQRQRDLMRQEELGRANIESYFEQWGAQVDREMEKIDAQRARFEGRNLNTDKIRYPYLDDQPPSYAPLEPKQEGRDSQERINQILNDGVTQTERLAQTARQMGDAFGNAFEDAILGAESFKDAARSLGYEIERILLRLTVTQPLQNALTGIFAGGFGVTPQNTGFVKGSNYAPGGPGMFPGIGGGMANGGTLWEPYMAFPISGRGPAIPLGEAGPEDIVPRSGAGARARGGVTIVQNFNGPQNEATMRRSTRQLQTDLKRAGF